MPCAGGLRFQAHLAHGLHAARGIDHIRDAVAGQDQQAVISAQARIADDRHGPVFGYFIDSGRDFLQRNGVPFRMLGLHGPDRPWPGGRQ